MSTTYPTTWRRPPQIIKDRTWRIGLQIAILVYLVLAIGTLEVNWERVIVGLERGQRFIMGFLQPDFTSRWNDIYRGLIESLTMTLTSTVIGVISFGPRRHRRGAQPGTGAGLLRLPRDHRRKPLLAGGDHRDLPRGDVRFRPLCRVPDAVPSRRSASSRNCSRMTSRRSMRPRPRPCGRPAPPGCN